MKKEIVHRLHRFTQIIFFRNYRKRLSTDYTDYTDLHSIFFYKFKKEIKKEIFKKLFDNQQKIYISELRLLLTTHYLLLSNNQSLFTTHFLIMNY